MTAIFEVDPPTLCPGWPYSIEPDPIACPYDVTLGSRPSIVITWISKKAVCAPIVQGALFLLYAPGEQATTMAIVPGAVIEETKAKQ
jgi:hypothetical protein